MVEKYANLFKLIKDTRLPMGWLITAGILALIETGASLWVPMLTKDLIDGLGSSSLDKGVILLLVVVLIGQAVFGGISYYMLGRSGHAVVARLRERLTDKLMSLPVPFYDKRQSGEMGSRVVSDTATLQSLVTDQLVSFMTGLVMISGSLLLLWLLDWQMTMVLFAAVILALAVILPIAVKLQAISKDVQDETASFTARMSRLLSEIRMVKAYTAEPRESRGGHQAIRGLFGLGLRETRIQSVMGPLMMMAMMGSLVLILGYGGTRAAAGSLGVGELVAFILYLFNIVAPLVQFTYFFTELQKATGASEHMIELLALEPERGGTVSKVGNTDQPIRFDNVSFSYSPEGESVLENIRLHLVPGEVTAIVGPSGSGKSTLFSLLERFYEPSVGSIMLGDTPIAEFTLASWRNRLGYVAQEAPVMAGTIRDNLCYGLEHEVSGPDLREAAKLAYADMFIESLPRAYDTVVGERGVTLSGGQRQRLAIARALLKDPGILMLDEATSSLDSETEQWVQKALHNLTRERTTLVIAHRLATVVNADRIVVLEDGRITGSGTHNELLASHLLYRKLVEQQFQPPALTRVSHQFSQ